jgi:chloramphenicol 3-O-phosphotransferase
MHFDIIWLNGTSSSGKTTLRRFSVTLPRLSFRIHGSLRRVFCPIDVLEQREAARGDRKVGLARYQSARVHENSEYDVEVETHELSPNQAAQKIISAPETIAPPTAFERLRSKVTTGAPPIASR